MKNTKLIMILTILLGLLIPSVVSADNTLSVNSATLEYPNQQNNIVATLDWAKINLNVSLPDMKSGDVAKLSFGENQSNFDYTQQPFVVGNYSITPKGNGDFEIKANVDTRNSNINFNISLRYNKNIDNDQKSVQLTPTIQFNNQVDSTNLNVNVARYVDKPKAGELLKKYSLGITKDGHAAWVIYWNSSKYPLYGNVNNHFIFNEAPESNQSIIKDSITAYDVNQPIINGERNTNHDAYNYDFSKFLQDNLKGGQIHIDKVGNDIFNGLDSTNSYYIYLETTLDGFNVGDIATNATNIKSAGNDNGLMQDSSDASVTIPPTGSGNENELTSVNVSKVWNDDNNPNRPNKVKVQLFANNLKYGDAVQLNDQNNWKYTFKDLPKFDKQNKAILYTVTEVDVPDGYKSLIENTGENRFTITNNLNSVNPGTNTPNNSEKKENVPNNLNNHDKSQKNVESLLPKTAVQKIKLAGLVSGILAFAFGFVVWKRRS